MAQPMICERCGGENPQDARFCIDCGATLARASTGPTTQLRGVECRFCHMYNPEPALFCASCGRSLAAPPPAPPAAAPQPRRPQHSYPRMATPPQLQPYRPAPISRPSPLRRNPGPLVFVIGLAVLLAHGALWPGILVLLGVSMLAGQLAQGRADRAVGVLLWFGGLALLFSGGRFWLGILVLLALSKLFGGWGGPFGRRW